MPKRLLLITPKFYGIETSIITELQLSGFEVVWMENRELPFDYHGTGAKFRWLRRIYFYLFKPQSRYIRNNLEQMVDQRFDILFTINCFIVCSYLFRQLKNKNPGLFSLLYLWDSTSYYSWHQECSYFDKVYTFDPLDAKNFNWHYLPNFYIDYRSTLQEYSAYDLFFIGKFSPERFYIIEKIINKISLFDDIRYFIKLVPVYKNSLHHRWFYFLLKYIRIRTLWINNFLLNYEVTEGIIRRDYIVRQPLEFDLIKKEFSSSNVILDLTLTRQVGYSHRLILALVKGKKVITTNHNIAGEDFFDAEKIKIIDNDILFIDHRWIKEKAAPLKQIPSDFLELSSWLKSIFNAEFS